MWNFIHVVGSSWHGYGIKFHPETQMKRETPGNRI